jgi:hypothetical protein
LLYSPNGQCQEFTMTSQTKTPRRVGFLHDPTGEHHDGMPTYPWGLEPGEDGAPPANLATRRQLAKMGLRPNGQEHVAEIRKLAYGWLVAKLYPIAGAAPKRPMTDAMWRAVNTAARSRYRCNTCPRTDLDYIPKQTSPVWGRCHHCYP